jgi:hypothetical protein
VTSSKACVPIEVYLRTCPTCKAKTAIFRSSIPGRGPCVVRCLLCPEPTLPWVAAGPLKLTVATRQSLSPHEKHSMAPMALARNREPGYFFSAATSLATTLQRGGRTTGESPGRSGMTLTPSAPEERTLGR